MANIKLSDLIKQINEEFAPPGGWRASDKIKKNKGSAIFIHLTKNYKSTAGCIAILKKDFLILAKLINKNSKIIIN